jgi:hypothetical protein
VIENRLRHRGDKGLLQPGCGVRSKNVFVVRDSNNPLGILLFRMILMIMRIDHNLTVEWQL